MKKSAFTLVELLVVISIIAILASIAVPVFGKAIEKAKATNCAANLRQLGLGVVAYLNDNEDQMFPLTAPAGGGVVTPWPITLQSKYVTNWKVFRSPFDKRADLVIPPGVPVSYGINQNLFAVDGGFNGSASKFVSPSQLIMMAPALVPGTTLAFNGVSELNVTVPMPSGTAGKYGTHTNRSMINVLYADTHVASIKYATEYSDSTSPTGLFRWLPLGQVPTPPTP